MKITKLLKTDLALKGLLIGLLYQVQPVWAAVCTTAPECVQTGTEGFIGGDLNGVYILPSVPNPSSFDTTRFTTTGQRINLLNHGGIEAFEYQESQLSKLLNVPVWQA